MYSYFLNKRRLRPSCKGCLASHLPRVSFHFRATRAKCVAIHMRLSEENGLCWHYGKTLPKPFLLVFSCHTKAIYGGLVFSLVPSAINKSCQHMLHAGLSNVIHRLTDAGYAENLVSAAILICASSERLWIWKTNVYEHKKRLLCRFSTWCHVI